MIQLNLCERMSLSPPLCSACVDIFYWTFAHFMLIICEMHRRFKLGERNRRRNWKECESELQKGKIFLRPTRPAPERRPIHNSDALALLSHCRNFDLEDK